MTKLRLLSFIGIMTALSVILARFFPIVNTPTIRVTLGGIPVMLTGIVCGPLPGALVGILSDFTGCVFSGYLPYLPLMISPVLTGLMPAVIISFMGRKRLLLSVIVSLGITSVITSVIWTPFALHLMTGTNMSVLIVSRLPFNILQFAAEATAIYLILKSKALERIFNK